MRAEQWFGDGCPQERKPWCCHVEHEDDDGRIREHWHCWRFPGECLKLHRTREEAEGCGG